MPHDDLAYVVGAVHSLMELLAGDSKTISNVRIVYLNGHKTNIVAFEVDDATYEMTIGRREMMSHRRPSTTDISVGHMLPERDTPLDRKRVAARTKRRLVSS